MKNELFKKFSAEVLGTFVFLGVIITVVNNSNQQVAEVSNWLKIGLALGVSIALFGGVSGTALSNSASKVNASRGSLSRQRIGEFKMRCRHCGVC